MVFFSVVLMNKKGVKKCISLPEITVGVRYCEFRYNIANFHTKRSVRKEIPSEVEVSVVKIIIIKRDDCSLKMCFRNGFYYYFFFNQHLYELYVVVCSGLTSLSTIFQSYHDGVWLL